MSAPNFLQVKDTSLLVGLTETETDGINLLSLTDVYGNLLTMTNFGAIGYVTIDPGTDTEEICSFTGITQNANGTATLTGITRALAAAAPYTQGQVFVAHSGSAVVVIQSDNPQLFAAIISYVNSLVLAAAVAASDTVDGYIMLTENLSVQPRAMAALVSQQASPNMTLFVNPFALSTLSVDVVFPNGLSQISPTVSAPTANPRIDLLVYDTINTIIALRTGTENASLTTSNWATYKPTPNQGDIVLCSIFNRHGETSLKERDDGTNGFIIKWYTPSLYGTAPFLSAGIVVPFSGKNVPMGYLVANGASVTRTGATAALFAVMCSQQAVTITLANPAVFTTTNNHGLVVGDQVQFQTTGSLPTPILANTSYYVTSVPTAITFQIALQVGGAVISTLGSSQSGVHTAFNLPYGAADGSHFYLPDLRSKFVMGLGKGANTWAFDSTKPPIGASVTATNSSSVLATGAAHGLTVNQRVQLTSPVSGFSNSVVYYVVSTPTATTFTLSATLGGSVISAGAGGSMNLLVYSIFLTTVTDMPYLGQPILYTVPSGGTAIGGLTSGTTYYCVPGNVAGEIMLATSLANAYLAQNGTQGVPTSGNTVAITSVGVGIHTFALTFTDREVIGAFGGEEMHALDINEIQAHTHTTGLSLSGSGSQAFSTSGSSTISLTSAVGGSQMHNNLPPFAVMVYLIKI